jgi:hypothetical protein
MQCNQYGYCGTHFGITLAAAGDWLFVGEPRSVPGEAPSTQPNRQAQPQAPGEVHVFRRGGDGSWSRVGRLQPEGSAAGDAFGAAIALADDRALIAAPNHSEAGDTAHARAGRVVEFVLENGAWREAATIAPTPQRNAAFGTAIAADGDVLVIGAPGSDNGRGAAHVYRRDARTGVWSEQSRLAVANAETGDRLRQRGRTGWRRSLGRRARPARHRHRHDVRLPSR